MYTKEHWAMKSIWRRQHICTVPLKCQIASRDCDGCISCIVRRRGRTLDACYTDRNSKPARAHTINTVNSRAIMSWFLNDPLILTCDTPMPQCPSWLATRGPSLALLYDATRLHTIVGCFVMNNLKSDLIFDTLLRNSECRCIVLHLGQSDRAARSKPRTRKHRQGQ
jgi:hypothetical protein